jgi:hypothetical protein
MGQEGSPRGGILRDDFFGEKNDDQMVVRFPKCENEMKIRRRTAPPPAPYAIISVGGRPAPTTYLFRNFKSGSD